MVSTSFEVKRREKRGGGEKLSSKLLRAMYANTPKPIM
jgi:hypothetical protein